jgi:hypothetical protein
MRWLSVELYVDSGNLFNSCWHNSKEDAIKFIKNADDHKSSRQDIAYLLYSFCPVTHEMTLLGMAKRSANPLIWTGVLS